MAAEKLICLTASSFFNSLKGLVFFLVTECGKGRTESYHALHTYVFQYFGTVLLCVHECQCIKKPIDLPLSTQLGQEWNIGH